MRKTLVEEIKIPGQKSRSFKAKQQGDYVLVAYTLLSKIARD